MRASQSLFGPGVAQPDRMSDGGAERREGREGGEGPMRFEARAIARSAIGAIFNPGEPG